ncbi:MULTISPECIES: DUF1015 family protein [unclassified Pedobacter]|uniref:DUF1015 family protein n=1 Tax=unclassified Pedobacter TaxID=2628915 RepID=UPI00142235F9|nr:MULTISPECIES: DUF1015 family protein [unclassified Pedobacter]NII81858.1 uncharacterized protein (DUF1015 family) [Pedobacter sp. SG908]NMN35861.1 uncharacterized protein (DUF1015 family) [Pedobacter sp. SG918]
MIKISPLKALQPGKDIFDLMISDQVNGKVHKNEQLSFDDLVHLFGCPIDDRPAIYVYEFRGEFGKMRGIWAAIDLSQTPVNAIKRHEETVLSKVESLKIDRKSKAMQKSPILLVHKKDKALDALIDFVVRTRKPLTSEWSQMEHFLYQVVEEDVIEKFVEEFMKLQAVYLADGHHRLEAACSLQKSIPQQISSLFVSADVISIGAFHRVVLGVDISYSLLMEKLKQYYYISKIPNNKAYKPDRKNRVGLCFKGEWYQLDLNEASSALLDVPDTVILQDKILSAVLGINKPKEDDRLICYPDCKWSEFLAELDHDETSIGFSLFPMTAEAFIKAAEKAEFLPPKSTWIAPKVPQGFMASSPVAIMAKGERVQVN